jgi:hypothetical protein
VGRKEREKGWKGRDAKTRTQYNRSSPAIPAISAMPSPRRPFSLPLPLPHLSYELECSGSFDLAQEVLIRPCQHHERPRCCVLHAGVILVILQSIH